MANNRIYIRCKECGQSLFLGKGFGGAYYTTDEFYKNSNLVTSLNNFYEEHCFCDRDTSGVVENNLEPKLGKRSEHYENNFEIAYESYYGDLKELEEEGK